VEETTANVTGTITNDGGAGIQAKGFDYDIDSGAPYANDVTANTSGTGVFNNGFTGLTAGELYFWRAKAINTGNITWGYGNELTFMTKPYPASSANCTDNGTTWLMFGWVNGVGADLVSLRYSTSAYPTTNTSGT